MKRTYIALAMLVAVGATAFAEVQKESATDGVGCFARWDATTLEVGNDAFTRSYIANGDRLRTVSFKTSAGRELIVAGNARAKGTLLVRGETARRSPTGAEGLVLHVTVGSESLVLRLWPSVPGVLVEWGRVRPLPEITGIEAPDAYRLKMRRSWKLFSTASSVSDPLLLAPDYLRITEYVLFDQTDCRNDLVKTMQRLVPSCQLTEEIRVTSLDVRDIASAAGLVFLRLAPMPESRPTDVPDFVVHAEDRGLAPLANGYPLAELAYEGGEAGRIRALQNLQRALRPYRAGRDGVFLSNTWGDGNRDLRINAEFLAKEVDAAAELGVDVIQIDDGWQRGRTANTGKPLLPGIPKSWGDFWDTDPRFWEPDAERFPQGLKPLADAAKAKGLGFGLWFGPDSTDDLRNWERDADCLLAFWRELGVRYFKIDSLSITSPVGMERNRKFFDKMLTESNADMVFDLDCTAALRPGYFGLPDIGPLFLENRYEEAEREIVEIGRAIRAVNPAVHLKVILETGALKERGLIEDASFLAMEAGADFIKTSTGKMQPAATPEAAQIMCDCILTHYKKTGRKVGFKPAGGIATPEDAVTYWEIVAGTLGKDWLDKRLFRYGASRMANNLLSALEGHEIKYY